MDIQEFSSQFDVLYNNITSNQAPGIDEYEKSVFLTKAQDQLVKEYFNARVDAPGGGYDGSQKRQYDFSSLVKTANLNQIKVSDLDKLDKRSLVYAFPSDYFLSVNELISDSKYQYNVIPLSYSEYSRLMMKPYAYPVKKGVWRLFTNKSYPSPISVTTLTNGTDTGSCTIIASTKETPINFSLNLTTTELPPGELDDITGFSISSTFNTNDTLSFKYSENEKWKIIVENYTKDVSTFTLRVKGEYGAEKITDEHKFLVLANAFQQLNTYLVDHPTLETPFKAVGIYMNNFTQVTITPANVNCMKPSEEIPWEGGSKIYKFTTFNNMSPQAEIIGRFTGEINYQLRYIKEPAPIILIDLQGTNLKLKGKTEESECELPEEMHEEILERAVTLAKITWAGGTATQVAAQQRNNSNQ